MPTTAPSTGPTRLVCGAAGSAARTDLRASNRVCSPTAKGAKSAFGCFGSARGFCFAAVGTDRIGRFRGTSLDLADAVVDGRAAACASDTTNTIASADTIIRNQDRANNRALPPPPDKGPPALSTPAGTAAWQVTVPPVPFPAN
ncbi:hypothetical protein AB0451_34005 [Streptomyces sp. NPDC052000]|uniref:hypothetical protein n=1 Tax=Streptomyces sp. NPDC052000 TaxID=3155676 RepID=UPI00344B3083